VQSTSRTSVAAHFRSGRAGSDRQKESRLWPFRISRFALDDVTLRFVIGRAAAYFCPIEPMLPFENERILALYRFLEQTAGNYMTTDVKTVRRSVTMRELGGMFGHDDFNTYPVEEDGEVIGIVTKFDILKNFAFTPNQILPRYGDLMNRTVVEVMTSEFIYVRPDTRLTRVLQLMVEHRVRSIPVTGGENLLVGIIAREDLLKALAETAAN
jgi:CBS domain-containing protein